MTLLNRSDRFRKRLEAYRFRSDQQKEKQAERDNIDAEVNFIFEGANKNPAGSTSQCLNDEKSILTMNILDSLQFEGKSIHAFGNRPPLYQPLICPWVESFPYKLTRKADWSSIPLLSDFWDS